MLDTLAGRAQGNLSIQGDIRVNGHHTKMSYGTVAYVPQQDLLTGTLTVYETLMFAAKLRYAKCYLLQACALHSCSDIDQSFII